MDGDSFSFSYFLSALLVPDSDDFAQSLLDGDIHHVVPLVQAVKTKFVSLFDSFYNLTPTKVFLIPSFLLGMDKLLIYQSIFLGMMIIKFMEILLLQVF